MEQSTMLQEQQFNVFNENLKYNIKQELLLIE